MRKIPFVLFFRWRFEALQNRCALMHREMVLENNSIKFEEKLFDNRQSVDDIFGANEEPMIDNFRWPTLDTPENIVTDTNEQKIASLLKASQKPSIQQQNDQTIITLPNKMPSQSLIYQKNDGLKHAHDYQVENAVFEQKKNMAKTEKISKIHEDTSNIMTDSIAVDNNMHLDLKNTFPSKTTQTQQKPVQGEDSARNINVEMFTVPLKRSK